MPITLDGTNGITTPTYGGADTSEYLVPVTQFKNRIINGAMQIDQRNAGASVTINTTGGAYTLDRYNCQGGTGGSYTVQQSSIAPTNFKNSLLVTVTGTDSPLASGDLYCISQVIEGFNMADLNFGTASAQTVTISFWVRSSVTGTFGGALVNYAFNRSYSFTYTISSANTWEQKSVTIVGDTTGTWNTNNSGGAILYFGLGAGSVYSTTPGSWLASGTVTATGATNLMATNGATFYITGVQLEVGSTATSFDYRPYGTELALCQRYYYLHAKGSVKPVANATNYLATQMYGVLHFPTEMRAAPTISATSGTNYYVFYRNTAANYFNSLGLEASSPTAYAFYNSTEISGTAGDAGWIETNSGNTVVAFSAEL